MLNFPLRPLIVVLLLTFGVAPLAHAQEPAPAASVEPAQEESDTPAAGTTAPDSPLASVRAYLEAAGAGRWTDAARYLSLTEQQADRAEDLARRLKGVIDSRHAIDVEALSADSEGRLGDGLRDDLEEIGTIPADNGAEPIRLIRTSDDSGAFWAFSTTTVARIDTWYADLPDRWLRELFTDSGLDVLLRAGPFGVLWWQWIAFPIVGLVSWGIGRAIRTAVKPIIGRLTAKTENHWDDQIVESIGPPLTLAFALLLFSGISNWMQLTPAADRVSAGLVRSGLVFAFFWGLWRSVRVVVAWLLLRPWATTNPSATNLLRIGSNVSRGAIAGLGILAMLAAVGYPVGTVLAGLGIGGLALAFGAQKTVENLFGSVSLAIDQPFRVGDFVKVEDFVGTVEDIGLRSTRFRTLDRTVVSIPNGKLSDQRLESFQVRDRMRLAMTLGVTYDTTRSQMQAVLAGFEQALRSHPKIWPDAVVVKFKEFGASSLDIEVMAWFQVPTWGDFQVCREEILLEFMRIVEEAGTSFAFPTRTVHLVQDGAPSAQ